MHLQVTSRVCSSELTAADSITQLLLTALTSTRLIDMQGAERERERRGGGMKRRSGKEVKRKKKKRMRSVQG